MSEIDSFIVSGGQKSDIKVLAGSVPSGGSEGEAFLLVSGGYQQFLLFIDL